jgi:flavin-dependent dehydrogenase
MKTGQGEVMARAVIGCDGPGSVVRKHFRVRPRELLQGIIAIRNEKDSSDHVEIWLDRNICDGFLWRIPRGDSVEYGMLGGFVKFSQLEDFFKLTGPLEKRAGLIPIGPCKSYFDRAILVGDSAGQTKPWSGGGVIYGMTCAGHAVKTLKKALDANDFSEEALSSYEDAWKAELDKPICLGLMARELFKEMGQNQFLELFKKLASMDLNKLDMDFPVLGF